MLAIRMITKTMEEKSGLTVLQLLLHQSPKRNVAEVSITVIFNIVFIVLSDMKFESYH